MTDCECSEREELQRVINIMRNWVLERNGVQFTMNDIYSDPDVSSKLDDSIGTVIVIDKALITLGCARASGDEPISLKQALYKPPNIRRIDRDFLCT